MELDRVALLRRGIRPEAAAIEIGPLDKPILAKPDYNVRYLDYATADELRKKYAPDPNVGDIPDVDIVWNGNVPLSDVVGPDERFAAVVASHVIEHVPDPIRWLGYFAAILEPGGVVSLAVPDMRVTFDVNRRLSEFSDVLDAYLRAAVVPSYAQLFDYHTKAIPADAQLLWAGAIDYTGAVRPGDLRREAFNGCIALRDTGSYEDIHCHTFTPESFVSIIEELGEFDLIDFAVAELVPTRVNTFEFFVRLERLDAGLSGAERRARQQAGVARAAESIAAAAVPAHRVSAIVPGATRPAVASKAVLMTVSEKERRLIERKRRIVESLRGYARVGRNRSKSAG